MRCPKCGGEGAAYVVKRPSHLKTDDQKYYKRVDFRIKCPKCGYEGF